MILQFAKTWGADRTLLQDKVPPGFFHQGLTAAEIAHVRGNCEAAAALGSTIGCPARHTAATESSDVWGVRGWTKTATVNGNLDAECEIPTMQYSPSKDWAGIIHEYSVNRQPLRITGLGRVLLNNEDRLLEPFTPEGLVSSDVLESWIS